MSNLTQMSGLAVQNFVSAAVGIAVAVALIRGLTRRRSETIGNFWVDLTRVTTRVLLPGAVVVALVLASQGVVQNLGGFTDADDGRRRAPSRSRAGRSRVRRRSRSSARTAAAPTTRTRRTRSRTRRASPISSRCGRSSPSPSRLPTRSADSSRDQRQGWAVFAAMFVLWIASAGVAMGFEVAGNPLVEEQGTTNAGNYEGKEIRFGPAASGLFAASTTGTSTGAVERRPRQLHAARRRRSRS